MRFPPLGGAVRTVRRGRRDIGPTVKRVPRRRCDFARAKPTPSRPTSESASAHAVHGWLVREGFGRTVDGLGDPGAKGDHQARRSCTESASIRRMHRLLLASLSITLGCAHAWRVDTRCDLEVAAAVPVGVQYATQGYQRPVTANPGCVKSEMEAARPDWTNMRWPQDLVTFKFAVLADGRVAGFEVLPPPAPPDRGFACMVWQAVTRCDWKPGRDPEGRPASLWQILPFAVK